MKIAAKYVLIALLFFGVLAAPAFYDVAKLKWNMRSPIPFDKGKWDHEISIRSSDASYTRLKMAAYIIEKNEISGLYVSDVEKMLGLPQSHEAIPGAAYWLSPFGLDSAWLQVNYTDNRVTSYRVVTD